MFTYGSLQTVGREGSFDQSSLSRVTYLSSLSYLNTRQSVDKKLQSWVWPLYYHSVTFLFSKSQLSVVFIRASDGLPSVIRVMQRSKVYMHGRDALAHIGDSGLTVKVEVVRRSNTLCFLWCVLSNEIVMNFYVPDFCLNEE